MSNEYSRSRSTSPSNIPWIWIGVLVGVILLIMVARSFSNENSVDAARVHLIVSPETSTSTVFIAMTESSKNRITGTGSQPLYVGDKSISVETGGAHAKNDDISIDLDERTELIYASHTSTGDNLNLTKGRIWINQSGGSTRTSMKNISVTTREGDIAMLEQNNQIYSTVYALKGDTQISTTVGDYALKAGNRIMVSASDLANPGLQLSTLVGGIDESILENPLFVKNNGKDLLSGLTATNTGTLAINSGAITASVTTQLVSILEPIDGSLASKANIPVRGSISGDIKRVTLNDQDSVVSPVNSTFTFLDFPITAEINNIVYKAYNSDGKQVEKGVITVFGSKQAMQSVTRLIPNTSPISSKDFKIVSPSSNPFVMTDTATKVQGTVPKDTVSYITVNDYRLQKYIPNSTSWYYFANMDSDTLKDGINLYTIKFYGVNNELLYTQLFTIIKESKNATLSGESSR